MTFLKCDICGNVAVRLAIGAGEMSCCGQPMGALTANTVDAAKEKHVPAVKLQGTSLSVQIGDVIHPMTDAHYIQFILVEQGGTVQYRALAPTDEPKATFEIDPAKPYTVYEYCNLHGLWKK